MICQSPRWVQKAAPQNLGNAEDDVPLWQGLDDMGAQPLAEFHHALLVARGAKMPPFARKSQQALMTAIPAANPRKAVVQVATVQLTVDHLPDIGPEKNRTGAQGAPHRPDRGPQNDPVRIGS
jgi:hypothetical protein